jgi:3-oxoacyl-(acyl-carrier-protein) synthase
VGKNVVITGIGMVTPLGDSPSEVLARIEGGITAFSRPPFHSDVFHCPYFAAINDFDAEREFPENKTLRLMNRDAQLAVIAANKAMHDAGIVVEETYPADEIALYGSTGMAGLGLEELTGLIRHAAGDDGNLDLIRFGRDALKRTRPVLSFKILANMPICFVSIFENIRGPNAIYTPWEGQGAYAIAAGVRAIRRGDAKSALVGGCDVKTHVISFIGLQQNNAFDSWKRCGQGTVPGEGAAFLVLEEEEAAVCRSAKVYARLSDYRIRSMHSGVRPADIYREMLDGLSSAQDAVLISASDGDPVLAEAEQCACSKVNFHPRQIIRPKKHLGNLYAGAAAVQVGLAAANVGQSVENETPVLVVANCFGLGDEQAAFVLEAVCTG